MNMADYIVYANQGATRNRPLSPKLVEALSFLNDMGLQAEVFSGGQPGIGTSDRRVGSTRHDHGDAADVFFRRGGERLDWANPEHQPVFQDVVRRGREAGLTGFGAGPGYMQPGSMHIGFGNPGVWGDDGKGANAPGWLREAFNGVDAPLSMPGGTPRAAAPEAPAGGGGAAARPSLSFGNAVASAAPSAIAGMFGGDTGALAPLQFGTPVQPQTDLMAMQQREEKRDRAEAERTRRTSLADLIRY